MERNYAEGALRVPRRTFRFLGINIGFVKNPIEDQKWKLADSRILLPI